MSDSTFKITDYWGTPKLTQIEGEPFEPTMVKLAGVWYPFRPVGRGSASMGHGLGSGATCFGVEVTMDGQLTFVSTGTYTMR